MKLIEAIVKLFEQPNLKLMTTNNKTSLGIMGIGFS